MSSDNEKWDLKICYMGAGYIAGPTVAVFAKMCPKIRVCVVDDSEKLIHAWKTDDLPIYEPALLDEIKSSRDKNLFFSTDVDAEINAADIIFIAVDTPTKSKGIGAGRAADIQNIELCARRIAKASTSDKIVVEQSTVPVRTADAINRLLTSNGGKGVAFHILSNPYFRSEGSAIDDVLKPDRLLIGSEKTPEGLKAAETLVNVYAQWVDREKILTTDLWSSELTKLVANALLAQRVSSINSISVLCEATGANVDEISRAVGQDNRIGSKFLHASIGFGGPRFQKDVLILVYLCQHYGLKECADYWIQVVLMNDYQKKRYTENILKAMFTTVTGKKMAILGCAYKANTGDVRESPALLVIRDLLYEGAQISVYDPQASREDVFAEMDTSLDVNVNNTRGLDKIVFEKDVYEACKGAHAICLLTNWSEFYTLDYERIYKSMTKPAFLFDGRNITDINAITKIGFEVHAIGKSTEFTDRV